MRWCPGIPLTIALAGLATVALGGVGERAPENTASRLLDREGVRQRLGLSPEFDRMSGIENIKIAVLDYGFEGLDGKRAYLPASAVVVEHYEPDFVRRHGLGDPEFQRPLAPGNTHGRLMAQIVWAVTGQRPGGPQFYLLNANGPTMFRRAVKFAIEAQVDIILFSGIFEGAGNGDGRGFINRAVSEALAAGIIWINAAGNFGGRTHEGPIIPQSDGSLRFMGTPDPTALRWKNRLDENTVTITLTWNDYRESEDAGTNKDLDLFVEDAQGRRVGSAEAVQVADRPAVAGETRNPRERLVLTDLPAGDYRIRLRAKNPGAFGPGDRFRVLITAERTEAADPKTGAAVDGLPFLDANGRGEIYPPADNPLVITVGDTSAMSSKGATADHRRKPDVLLADSRASFSTGLTTTGASNAAAYFAGIVAVLKAAEPRLAVRHLLTLAHPASTTRLVPKRPLKTPAPQTVWQTPTRRDLAALLAKETGRRVMAPTRDTTRPKPGALPP